MTRTAPAPQDVETTHPDRVLFDDGTTKGELVDYYRRVAPVMVPHLRGRPLMLQRFPRGVDESGFYQKEAGDQFPDWVTTRTVEKEGGTVTHVVCEDEATLVHLANFDCVTLHSWLGDARDPYHPDRLVFDLDPSGNDFGELRSAAYALRDLLTELGLAPYVQTTGSRGLHVTLPLDRSTHVDDVRSFAREVAESLADERPDQLTVEASKDKRGKRIYLDVLRNAYAQTAVAPYSVRAMASPTVATPVRWDELSRAKMHADRYTIESLQRRLTRTEDPWADMERHAGSAAEAHKRFARRRG
ncbi:MAG: non-homologous end-joining DNA ligase [Streptosporangiales bacterium]